MHLSLARLRLFVALVEEASFTAAARRIGATQSGVSQQLRRLEESVGVSLVDRTRGSSTSPTPAGRLLYQRSLGILRDVEELELNLRGHTHGLQGSLRVGLMPVLTRRLMGPAMQRLIRQHPNAMLRVTEAVSGALIEQVKDDVIDIAVIPAINSPEALNCRFFATVPEVLVASADPATHLTPVDLRKIGPIHIVVPHVGNIRRSRILGYLSAIDAPVERIVDLDSMFGALDLVSRSNFVTLLPDIMLQSEIADGTLCVRPLDGPQLNLDMMTISRRGAPASPLAAEFIGLLAEGVSSRRRAHA